VGDSDTQPNVNAHVIVVGAGLAGLSCARHLASAGADVTIIEASDGVGGRVRTDTVDGFRLDRGFQVLLRAYPELHRQLDVDALNLCTFDPGALIRHDTGFSRVADPFRAPRALPATLWAALRGRGVTPADLLRLGLLRRDLRSIHPARLLSRPETATIDRLSARGFSTTAIETFFGPLVGGIQLDPTLTTSSRMFDVILRMLLDDNAGVPATGMSAVSDALAAPIMDKVRLDEPVVSVSPHKVSTRDGEYRGDAIVIATDGPAAARLIGIDDPGSRPAAAVHFAAPRAPSPTRSIVLDHRGPARNVAIMSNVAPSYAPSGHTLVTAAVPGVADTTRVDTEVQSQLARWWGPEVMTWDVLRVDVIPHGQPIQAPVFSPKKPVRLDDGLFVCGDHRDTGSIQGAMYSGRRCAEAVIGDLTGLHAAGTLTNGDT